MIGPISLVADVPLESPSLASNCFGRLTMRRVGLPLIKITALGFAGVAAASSRGFFPGEAIICCLLGSKKRY